MKTFKDKKIALLGMGMSSLALAQYLKDKGAEITGCDAKESPELLPDFEKLGINFRLGDKYLDNLLDFEMLFVTPGMPTDLEELRKAKDEGVEITSEIKLFFELCPCPIIGITGTNGKSTTTTLVGELLKTLTISHKLSAVLVGGNIGEPVIDKLNLLDKNSLAVLELSSFQIELLDRSPNVSVFLNITPDHLDRYENFEAYFEVKRDILKYHKPNDYTILIVDDPLVAKLDESTNSSVLGFSTKSEINCGAYLKDDNIHLRFNDIDADILNTNELQIPGMHNIYNILAAVLVAAIYGVKRENMAKVLKNFQGVEHRIEFIRELNGVKYYNDSKATTPESTIAAVHSFKEPIILILGGYDKHADFKEMAADILDSTTKEVILIGETADLIAEAISNKQLAVSSKQLTVERLDKFEDAIRKAKDDATSGDIILLSPACASFDMFKNFEERGKIFKEIVNKLP